MDSLSAAPSCSAPVPDSDSDAAMLSGSAMSLGDTLGSGTNFPLVFNFSVADAKNILIHIRADGDKSEGGSKEEKGVKLYGDMLFES